MQIMSTIFASTITIRHLRLLTVLLTAAAFGLIYFMDSMILADFYYFCSNYNSNE